MIIKRVLRPERLRQIPPSFSWLDHRLVSQDFLGRCDPLAWALYLFLVTVADVQGLSYYSEASIGRRLRLDLLQLATARQQLIQAELIAYQKPLYQVLALDPALGAGENRGGPPQSAGDILRRVLQAKGGTP